VLDEKYIKEMLLMDNIPGLPPGGGLQAK